MNFRVRIIFICLLLVMLSAVGHGAEKKQILILNSYHKGYPWTDSIVKGIEETLTERIENCEILIEYMDTKRIKTNEYNEAFFRLMKIKYSKQNLDIIIVSDDNAFLFAVRYHRRLFNNTPIVFMGVNHFTPSMIDGHEEQITGIVQDADIFATLNTALELHPNTTQVAVICDATTTGQAYIRQVTAVESQFETLEFIYLDGIELATSEMLAKLSSLPNNSIALLCIWLKDKNGVFVPWERGYPDISKNSTVPLYGVLESMLQYGILGGKVQSGKHHGAEAAEIALKLLKGKKVTDIPVRLESPNTYMFNYQQLQRWNIQNTALPQGSIILNEPESVYYHYKNIVWGIIGTFAFLIVVIAVLSSNSIRRKSAEENLRESEEKYKSLANNLNVGIYRNTVGSVGKFIEANPAIVEMFGFDSRDEFLKVSVSDLYKNPYDRKEYSAKILKEGRVRNEELLLQKKDGTSFIASVSAVVLKDEKDEVKYCDGILEDITERKQTEAALRESEEKYRGLASSLPQVVFETDVTGNLTFVNQNAFDLFRYTKKEFDEGLNALQMIIPEDRDRALENMQKIMNGNIIGGIEYTAQRRDCTTFPVVIHSNLFMRDNKLMGLRGLIIDLSKRKKMETDIKRRAMAMHQSTETIVITDTKGLIVYVNPAFEKTTGYSREEALGKNPGILKSGNQDEMFYHELWQTISGGKTWSGCFVNKKKEGSQYTEEATISPIFSDKGEIVNYVAVKRDISDRLKLEARLQQSEKMEAIGLLAGGVAHDLNNVLSGIVSYPDLLLMDLRKDSPLRNPLLTIQKSGKKAADIVQDLLTLARRGVTNKNVLNVNDVIQDYLKSPEYEKLITYHSSVSVETNLDKKLMNIEGSSIQLRKILMNLVSNAAEAQPSGGKIIISTRNQYVDMPIKGYEEIEEGEFAILEVKDSGFGIAAEDLTRIFEPFYTKKVMGRSGTGLGMAVVWGTIHDHNGYIDVESTEGVGTTFYLFFPVTREKYIRKTDLIPVEEYFGRKEAVLVIDDIIEQRDIATNILDKLNYSVTTVSCGEDAVKYMEKNSVDLLVLDMIMEPGIDGLETYRKIITLHPNQKAIITSGYSETDRVKEAQRLGAGEYIKKPYTLEKIGLAVKKELQK